MDFAHRPRTVTQTGAQLAATTYFPKIALGAAQAAAVAVSFNESGASTTAAGTVKCQGSNRDNPTDGAAAATEWTDLDVAFSAAVTSGAGVSAIPMSGISYKWMRTVFTRTGGTGTLVARTHLK